MVLGVLIGLAKGVKCDSIIKGKGERIGLITARGVIVQMNRMGILIGPIWSVVYGLRIEGREIVNGIRGLRRLDGGKIGRLNIGVAGSVAMNVTRRGILRKIVLMLNAGVVAGQGT